MRHDDLRQLLQRDPTPRLRLHLTGGKTFDITDPEHVVVTRTTVELLIPDEPDREAIVSLLHIIWVEVISLT